jgi:pyruvate dehydrogenase (quinone)
MAGPKVPDYLLERLRAWNVEKVFGYPGDGINGLLAAWGRVGNQPKFIQARVAKPLLGKDVLSDELPFVTEAIGLLGTRPSYELMRDCDTLLTVGSSFPYTRAGR